MDTYKGGSIRSVVMGAVVGMLPAEALDYAGKIFSVFLLAVVAELGRRLVVLLWREKK